MKFLVKTFQVLVALFSMSNSNITQAQNNINLDYTGVQHSLLREVPDYYDNLVFNRNFKQLNNITEEELNEYPTLHKWISDGETIMDKTKNINFIFGAIVECCSDVNKIVNSNLDTPRNKEIAQTLYWILENLIYKMKSFKIHKQKRILGVFDVDSTLILTNSCYYIRTKKNNLYQEIEEPLNDLLNTIDEIIK